MSLFILFFSLRLLLNFWPAISSFLSSDLLEACWPARIPAQALLGREHWAGAAVRSQMHPDRDLLAAKPGPCVCWLQTHSDCPPCLGGPFPKSSAFHSVMPALWPKAPSTFLSPTTRARMLPPEFCLNKANSVLLRVNFVVDFFILFELRRWRWFSSSSIISSLLLSKFLYIPLFLVSAEHPVVCKWNSWGCDCVPYPCDAMGKDISSFLCHV